MGYEFEHDDMRFTRGGLDEKIALDRYSVSTTNPKDFAIGDTVVFIDDEAKGTRKVGTIFSTNAGKAGVESRDGAFYDVALEHITKPLELTPQSYWARWAYGAASVEAKRFIDSDVNHDVTLTKYEDEYRWLFDGFRYSPGGRIQLGLGHEYLGLDKANLTLSNCFVGTKVERADVKYVYNGKDVADPIDQWRKVLANLRNQIEIQRRGGGYGVNISEIATVSGLDGVRHVTLHLPEAHADFDELQALKRIGKFDSVDSCIASSPEHHRSHEHLILVPDSIDGIMASLNEMVTKLYEGHDVIVSFGALRPRHSQVSNIGRSSGAASWMTIFALAVRLLRQETIDGVDFAELPSFTTNLVEQGGSRRGALMLVMNVESPCIEKFITRKREVGRLVGANISVAVTDAFMGRVKRHYRWMRGTTNQAADMWGDEDAYRIWSLIIESAHASAEPGVLFVDTINNESNSWYYEKLETTNPCGEQPLPADGACNLGHLVLPRFIVGDWTKRHAVVDYVALERAVRLGVRFQDDMIDYSLYPTPATKAQQQRERRVGMGTMGLGTSLIMLGLRYGSDEASEFIDELYAKIAYWAYDESINLAAEKGVFPAFEYDKYVQSGFMKRILARFPLLDKKLRKHGIRNATLLTQAPTGSTGTMIDLVFADYFGTGCTTGIEPAFSLAEYERAGRLGVELIVPKIVETYRKAKGLSHDDGLPDYFVDAQSLSPDDHVRVQAMIQRWVDSAISKTANCPESFTVGETARLYEQAYDLGCKGVTIYRANSRQAQVLSTERGGAKIEAHIEAEAMVNEIRRAVAEAVINGDVEGDALESKRIADEIFGEPTFTKRPTRVYGFTEKIKVPVGNERLGKVYVTIGLDEDGRPFEVFVNANDEEIVDIAQSLGRMVTQMLRYGGTSDNVDQAIKHLRRGQTNMFSLPSQLARLLEEVTYKGVEFPSQERVIHDPPAPPDSITREEAKEIIAGLVNSDGFRRGRSAAAKLAKCSTCGEHQYDKANCICHACGTSKCN